MKFYNYYVLSSINFTASSIIHYQINSIIVESVLQDKQRFTAYIHYQFPYHTPISTESFPAEFTIYYRMY